MRFHVACTCPCLPPVTVRDALEGPRARREDRRSRFVPLLTRASASNANTTDSITLVGMGSVGMDFLASVASFPKPDDKMRTEELQMQGGGNCGNALTAAARLLSGLSSSFTSTVRVVSKIGTDAAGDAIMKEFAADGIDTSNVLVTSDKSPFTYIIVDRETSTRTCIHTPGDPYLEEEMTPARIDGILDGASAVYFDGRLAEPALLLARAARAKGIRVLVEAERLRPGLDKLLAEADYVVTSTGFPREWTGIDDVEDAMAAILTSLPYCAWVITTLGKRGSLLLEGFSGDERSFDETSAFDQMGGTTTSRDTAATSTSISVDSISSGASSSRPFFPRERNEQKDIMRKAREEAAARAALMNADEGKGSSYDHDSDQHIGTRVMTSFRLTTIDAASIEQSDVVDTTGAGDAFIGTMLFSVAMGLPPAKGATLASVVAAAKCRKLGARPGLVRLEEINGIDAFLL